jgi:hypothetical protein
MDLVGVRDTHADTGTTAVQYDVRPGGMMVAGISTSMVPFVFPQSALPLIRLAGSGIVFGGSCLPFRATRFRLDHGARCVTRVDSIVNVTRCNKELAKRQDLF